ncbi:MAG: tRNA pseudouridine(38-40) synthase TruA [Gammaproteobacteria bacterium]|nr:tRNA pseudouridine(38-40) synthase TruA [Gammaproteobacteria bacterium]
MKRIALGIEYQGTQYCGYQKQLDCPTVQGHLEAALADIANEPIALTCAGRTDTGVHAVGQVVHFETKAARGLKAWVQGANTKLPTDIRISWAKEVTDTFHARFSAGSRQYRYVIFNRPVASAVLANRVTHVSAPLDDKAMHEAAQSLLGEHDFSSFRASGCQANNAIRTVEKVSVTRQADFIFIDIQANAFLHHMVRNITGTLLQVGQNKSPVEWVAEVLALQDRTKAGVTAPAAGLYFVNAFYPERFGLQQVVLDGVLWHL